MTSKYLNAQFIYVDSHNRLSGSHNDFTYLLDLHNLDVDTVCCIRTTIKKSYYLVPEGQNTFVLIEGGNSVTLTIPKGNYSASSFRYVLLNLLNTNSPNHWTYAISLPNPQIEANTGLYTFSVSGNTSQPSFQFTTYLYEQFGFEPNSTNTFSNNTLTSQNVLNFQLKDTLRIHSDLVGKDGKNNILQEITCLSPDFSALTYECQDIEANSRRISLGSNTAHFIILDEDAQAVSLSLNILITLLVYKKNTVTDTASKLGLEYMKFQMLKE
jgi:hypothetical protein